MRQFKEGETYVFAEVPAALNDFYNDMHGINIIKGTKFIINTITPSSMMCRCLDNNIILLNYEYDCFTNYREPKGILKYI